MFTAGNIRPFTATHSYTTTTGKESCRTESCQWASLGNFTLDGLLEESVHIGDRFSIGSAEVIVTQPRLPCYKLGIRFEADDMVKRFFVSGRTGFYLAVASEGEVGAGDEMRVISRDQNGVPVLEITRLYAEKRYSNADVAWVQRALRVAALPESWKEYFRQRLEQIPTLG